MSAIRLPLGYFRSTSACLQPFLRSAEHCLPVSLYQQAVAEDPLWLPAQIFAGLLVGAMLPYWFSAMTMKSVGKAALAMVEEVRRQFNTIPGIMEGTARPDYRLCVEISTQVRSPLSLTHLHEENLRIVHTPLMCLSRQAVLDKVAASCPSRDRDMYIY